MELVLGTQGWVGRFVDRYWILRLLKRLAFGLLAFEFLCLPLLFGLLAYGLSSLLLAYGLSSILGVWTPTDCGKLIGFLTFILAPAYLLGHALDESYKRSRAPSSDCSALSPSATSAPSHWPRLTIEQVTEIWKVSIEMHQHFDDLELRIRNFAVTELVAVLGATAFAFKEDYQVIFRDSSFPVAVAILFAGIIGWSAFYFMDRHWYHRLLLGSVSHTTAIELSMAKIAPHLGLAGAIGRGSPLRDSRLEIHSPHKIDLFYGAGLAFLVILLLLVSLSNKPREQPGRELHVLQPVEARTQCEKCT